MGSSLRLPEEGMVLTSKDIVSHSSFQHLRNKDDLTQLTDSAYVAKILSETPSELSQKEGAKTGWRGLGTRLEYTDLV